MQTSSREIILDQLQQVALATSDQSALISEASSALNSLALLDTTLRELLPTSPLEHIARALAEATRHTLEMDMCAVMLTARENGHLTMQAASPDLNGRLLAIPPLRIETALWEKLHATPGQLPVLSVSERDQLNPLKNVQYESLHIVPLAVGRERVGLLYCYSSKARDLDKAEQLIVQTLASFAAMSLMSRRLLDEATSTISVKSFFDDLLAGDTALEESLRGRAAALGCNCAQPHVMLVLEIAHVANEGEGVPTENGESRQAACRHALKLVEQRLREHYPGSLFDEREHRLYAMIALAENASAAELKKRLDTLLQQVESGLQVSLRAGISSACHELRDYTGGFSEAQEALTIAGCLNACAASMQFSDVGAYRYIYPFARDHTHHDLYLEQIAIIARYDQVHKRAELLNTLEVYLEHWGNIKEASELLDVHRNTVTQRLERIQSLCAIDLAQYSHWLPLQVAILIHRLRAKGA
ncbi:MAG: helix-turn-helix domain-containing protein [Ktedonobacteraceae bacterium]